MQDLYKLRRLFAIAPAVAVNKINEMPIKKIQLFNRRHNLYKSKTYSQSRKYPFVSRRILNLPEQEFLEKQKTLINFLYSKFSAHTFDLLGSGATTVTHNGDYLGFEGHKYQEKIQYSSVADFINSRINATCRQIALKASEMLSPDYFLIDWQRDFRSGFRFDERKSVYDITYGNTPGADVKIPWELGRLQHLPIFAYHYYLNKDYYTVREFCNEIIDFYISNPPYFGVQWKCTMDVAIRTINLLVAYSFMEQAGAQFTDDFSIMFANMIYDHLNFVEDNAEWSSGMRGNHYFAGVCAMLVGSLCAGEDSYYRSMLFASASELSYEIMHQFNADGSNFEASLPYHFFTFEMLAVTLIVLENQSQQALIRTFERCGSTMMQVKNFVPLLTEKLQTRIYSAIEFSETFIKNGKTFNIGDFDSGKFLKLTPSVNYIQSENFDNPTNLSYITELIRHIKSNKGTPEFGERKTRLLNITDRLSGKPNVFTDFGIYINNQKNYSTVFRCGKIGQRGKGGHAHNDQLSIAVKIAGQDFIVDPGTYVYTSCPELRNQFRLTSSHNTLIITGKEQNPFATANTDDLFWFKTDRTKGKFSAISDSSVSAFHKGYGIMCSRKIDFLPASIHGSDSAKSEKDKFIRFHLAPEVKVIDITSDAVTTKFGAKTIVFSSNDGNFSVENYYYSPAYGMKTSAKVIALHSFSQHILWQISILNNQ